MVRFVFALLALTLPAHGATFTSFVLRYDTAPILNYSVSGPGVPNDSSAQFLGQSAWFELYLQLEGAHETLPDGRFLVAPGSSDFFYAEVSNLDGLVTAFQFALEFFEGRVTFWQGFAVDEVSSDGLYIDSEGVDLLKPFVWDELRTIAAGSWTIQSQSIECFPDTANSSGGAGCSNAPPNPDLTAVPLPALFPTFLLSLLLLTCCSFGRRESRVVSLR